MRRLAIAALSLSFLVGCASQKSSDSASATPSAAAPKPSPDASSPGANAYTFRLPIAVYSYSDADYALIRSAEQVLARECMKSFGFSYTPPEDPAPTVMPDRRYGLSEMSTAARYGYRPPPETAEPEARLTEDQATVLYGRKPTYEGKAIPDRGCLGKAVLDLRKPYEYKAGSAAASHIATTSYRNSLKDPKVRAVFAEWSSCMKRKGYTYASPMDALEAPAFREGSVSDQEKKTAMADVSCKESTGLLDTWFKAESAIQKGMIEKDLEVLQKLSEMHRKKVSAARKTAAGT
jgi:hypothetical protein